MNRDHHATGETVFSSDIENMLQDMGLTQREIEIYEYLLSTGGSVPSAIARETGLPRGRIYEGMRNLVAKGFVQERPTRPIVFLPAPITDVLAAAQARLTRHLHAVRQAQALNVANPAGAAAPPQRAPMRMRDVRVLSGRRACLAEMSRMADNASQFFWLSGNTGFSRRLANMPRFLDGLRGAVARGVDVRLFLPSDSELATRTETLPAGTPQIRILSSDSADSVLACGTELASLELLAQPDDDSPSRGDDVAIQVGDPTFAARLRRRFDAMLAPAMTPPPAASYQWLGPDHGSDMFRDAVSRSAGQIQVLGPAEWGTYLRARWATDGPLYEAAARRGVALRAVATSDAASDADLHGFRELWKLRFVADLPMWLTIIDGQELFQAFPHASLGGPPQFRRSTEGHEVRFYQAVFERLWGSGGATATAAPAGSAAIAPPGLFDRVR